MKITVFPGRYIVAVSGGVDSMVLLDFLSNLSDVELVVAHLDHGIRPDASLDRQLVAEAAERYGLPFEYQEAKLGPQVSEAEARVVRYEFLKEVKDKYNADAIITAHHQDDLLETAMLNLLRGTGRKGLSSLRSSDTIVRPLLGVSKADIREYAQNHGIVWREDSTNQDERYLRNFVRRQLLIKMPPEQKRQLAKRLEAAGDLNEQLDTLLLDILETHLTSEGLKRGWFIQLPHDVSTELMATWLREQGIREFDRKAIKRLVVAAKTALPGKVVDVNAGRQLHVGKDYLRLIATSIS